MSFIRKTKLSAGLYVVEVEEANLVICCGCPPDTIKYLKKGGFLNSEKPSSIHGALLLSDTRVRKGRLTNFAEFPIMELLYNRGMIANVENGGELPIIIGMADIVDSQVNYLSRGNYGYYSLNELMESDLSRGESEKYWNVKLHFADNKIHHPNELCVKKQIGSQKVEIKNNVFVSRKKADQFLIEYDDDHCVVDFHMLENGERELPYRLGDHTFQFTEFSVIHSGEGNGWEPENPCMGSIIIYKGKIYAVDTGPGFLDNINHLGLDVQDIEGVFLTHIHDDHFAGITDLLKATEKIKLYCSQLVRVTAQKKFSELLDLDEEAFSQFFECKDLDLNDWSDVEGLQVKPFFSPHPVETNAFIFKYQDAEEEKIYGHLADTFSINDLKELKEKQILTKSEVESIIADYLLPCDVKKVDVGGGAIHGDKSDYIDDRSDKIIFSHNKHPSVYVKSKEQEGRSFGRQDVLERGNEKSFLKNIVFDILASHFESIDKKNSDRLFAQGEVFRLKRDDLLEVLNHDIYLVLHGNVVRPNVSFAEKKLYDRTFILGFNEFFDDSAGQFVVHTSFVTILKLEKRSFIDTVSKLREWESLKALKQSVKQLSKSYLFSYTISSSTIIKLVKNSKLEDVDNEMICRSDDTDDLFFVVSGSVSELIDEQVVRELTSGDFFGGDHIFEMHHPARRYDYLVTKGSVLLVTKKHVYSKVPLINWMIYENKTVNELQNHEALSPVQEELIEAFNKSDLFKVLDEKSQLNVSKLVHRLTVKAGDTIVKEGEASDRLFLIVNGIGVVKKGLANEPEKILAYLMPGNTFGEVGILENKPRSATVSALTDAELIEIPSALFEDLLMKFPRLGIELSKMLGYYLTQTNNRITRGNKDNHLIAVFSIGNAKSGLTFSQSISEKITEQTGHRSVFIHYDGTLETKKVTSHFKIDSSTKSFDILQNWSELNFPKDSRISMTADRLLNTYDNLVIFFENIPEENLSIIFENLNQMIIISDQANWTEAIDWRESIKRQISHRNVEFFMLKEMGEGGDEKKVIYQFPERSVSSDGRLSFGKTVSLIADRLERNNRVGIFIPTTVDVNQKVDTSEFVNEALKFLGQTFGGATSEEAIGVWNSKDIGIVDEKVFIVHSYTTAKVLKENLNVVVDFVKTMKDKLKQESMALEINKRLTLI